MNNNIVKFPEMEKIDDDKVISTPAKDTGIKTISKLRKSVSEIDIEKIFKVTDVGRYYPYYSYDEDTNSYKGIKLELEYLTKILEAEKNSIDYSGFNEVNDIYANIMNSDAVSSAIKERVNKIHEFYSNK